MVQDSVARFVDDAVLPIIRRALRQAHLPARAGPRDRGLGLLGSLARRLRLRRHERGQLRPDLPGTRARRLGHPQLRLGAVLAVHVPDLHLRQRGAEAAVPAAHGARRAHRLLRPDRTARRLRPGQHEDAREAPTAATGSSTARRCGSPTAPIADIAIVWATDRGRHPRLPGRARHAGLRDAGDPEEVLPARLGHRRAVLRRRARAGTAMLPGSTCRASRRRCGA